MAPRLIDKVFMFGLALVFMEVGAYFYSRAVMMRRIPQFTYELKENGWTHAHQLKMHFQPCLFGASATLQDFSLMGESNQQISVGRLTVTSRPFAGPVVTLRDADIRLKAGTSIHMPHLAVIPAGRDSFRFATERAGLNVQNLAGRLALLMEDLTGTAMIRRARNAQLEGVGVKAQAKGIRMQDVVLHASRTVLPLSTARFSNLDIAVAVDLCEIGVQPCEGVKQLYLQKLTGQFGALHVDMAGEVGQSGDGHMTLRASGVKAAFRQLPPGADTGRETDLERALRQISRKMGDHVPDTLTIPLEIGAWRITSPRLDVLLTMPSLNLEVGSGTSQL